MQYRLKALPLQSPKNLSNERNQQIVSVDISRGTYRSRLIIVELILNYMAKKATNQIPFVNDWKQWMTVTLSLGCGTIHSYADVYLPAVERQMIQKIQANPAVKAIIGNRILMTDVLPILLKNNSQAAIGMLYLLLCEWQNNHASYSKVSNKTASNYASAFACYIEFLLDMINIGQISLLTNQVKGTVVVGRLMSALKTVITGVQIYPLAIIKQAFKLRISTQDRFPICGIYFPIRLIKKIFYSTPAGKRWFDNWLEQVVNNIKVLTKQSMFRLRQVEFIEIKNHNVWVKVKGAIRKYRILTRTFTPGRPDPDNMVADTLADISIDHDIPICTVLCNGGWQALDDLSKLIDEWREQKIVGTKPLAKQGSKIAHNLHGPAVALPNIIDRLKYDLTKIAQGGLTIMERGENSKKNNLNAKNSGASNR